MNPPDRLFNIFRDTLQRDFGVDDSGRTINEPLLPWLWRLLVMIPIFVCAVLAIFVVPVLFVLLLLGLL